MEIGVDDATKTKKYKFPKVKPVSKTIMSLSSPVIQSFNTKKFRAKFWGVEQIAFKLQNVFFLKIYK